MTCSRLWLLSLVALAACAESVESDDILTDGIYADLRAVGSESGTRVIATLRVGGSTSNTYVMLLGDDVLRASADGETVTLRSQNLGDFYSYAGELASSAGGTEVVFRFDRSIDDGAPDSHCELPAPAEIVEPVADATFRRAQDDLVITWDRSGTSGPVYVEVDGPCIQGMGVQLGDDPGSYTFEAGALQSSSEPPEACSATVQLSRDNGGTLDPGFGEGGRVLCRQVRQVSIRLDP